MTLDELKALEAAATPGPWESTGFAVLPTAWITDGCVYGPKPFIVTTGRTVEPADQTDAALIAAARNMLPRLIAVAEAAKRVRHEFSASKRWAPSSCALDAALADLEAP